MGLEPAAVIVTGATGWVGARVAGHLAHVGRRVVALARLDSDVTLLTALAPSVAVTRAECELPALRAALVEARAEAIVHVAAWFVAEHRPDDVPGLIAANLTYPALLAEAAHAEGVTTFVSAGSFWEAWEPAAPGPVNLYAAYKRAFKEVLAYYAGAHGLRACHLRLPDVYGPGDPRPKVLKALRDAVRTGAPLAMSDGRQRLDLVHVADVTAAFEAALARTAAALPGLAEHSVTHTERHTLRELVAVYGQVVRAKVPVSWGARPARRREVMDPVALPPVPGWTPRFTLAAGLRDVEMAPGGLLHARASGPVGA
jgi:nucleoside-diphosphate-sugar epimerase